MADLDPQQPAPVAMVLRWAERALATNAAPASRAERRREAAILLRAATGWSATDLIAWPERMLTATGRQRFLALVERRGAGEPIAYLLGRREFWDIDLEITPATLIPRPETEGLVDWALATLPADAHLTCADLGTGSGAIALALARERPRWQLLALERDAAALAVAASNARRLAPPNLVLIQSDWLTAIGARRLDAIVANPPYVAAHDPHLAHGDARFEPRAALVAGVTGLEAIDAIARTALDCLKPGGGCAIEHGWDQAAEVRERLRAASFERVGSQRDLAGIERVTSGWRPC